MMKYLILCFFIISCSKSDLQLIESEPDCDIGKTVCKATLPDDNSIELTIKERPVQMQVPLTFEVKSKYPQVKFEELYLEGVAMDMGFNKVPFQDFIAKPTLNTCTQDSMIWKAVATMTDLTGKKYGVVFRFEAFRKK